jgi:predicted membrane chloride channel (bestrophin family)
VQVATELSLLVAAFPRATEMKLRLNTDDDYRRVFAELLGDKVEAMIAAPNRGAYLTLQTNFLMKDAINAGHIRGIPRALPALVTLQKVIERTNRTQEAIALLQSTPEPWSYQKHMRFTMAVWLTILPVALVRTGAPHAAHDVLSHLKPDLRCLWRRVGAFAAPIHPCHLYPHQVRSIALLCMPPSVFLHTRFIESASIDKQFCSALPSVNSYVVFKLDDVAVELTNPYGFDKSDLHICVMNDALHEELKYSLATYLRHHSGSCYKYVPVAPAAVQPAAN